MPLVGWAHALAVLYRARCKLLNGEKAPARRYGPANAHAALYRAVFAAYGWPGEIDDEDIRKSLLALDLERRARIGAPDAPVAQATRNHPVPPPG